VGKPNPFMFRAARKKLGLSSDEVLMVGDTMETDIRGATDSGFQSILVLTGSTRSEDLHRYPFRPTVVVDSIAALVPEANGDGDAILKTVRALRKAGKTDMPNPLNGLAAVSHSAPAASKRARASRQ
jgi:NagD protein